MRESIKPQEIKELEKVYGIELKESDDIKKSRSYQVDENKNIVGLNLRLCNISDICLLSNLKNLQKLNLFRNDISDISPLSNLKNLQELDLTKTKISDISSLSNLEKLQELYLGWNSISDISSLSNLVNLQSLGLEENRISDIGPLSNLENLQSLGLEENRISNINPLSSLINLQSLRLGGNSISDISSLKRVLKNLKLLKILFISNNPFLEKIDLKLGGYSALNDLKNYFSEPIESIKKVMLLGNHDCGKSSFLDNFLGETKENKSTHILDIVHYKENQEDTLPKAIIYDFGGQDYYHGLYKAFMTNRSTNLIFWKESCDNNKTSEDKSCENSEQIYTQNFTREYWIKQLDYYDKINSKKDNKYWLVQTHIDENKTDNEENIKFIDNPKLSKNIFREFHINNEDSDDLELKFLKEYLKIDIDKKTRTEKTSNYKKVLKYILSYESSEYKTFEKIKEDLELSKEKTEYFLTQLSREGLILYYPNSTTLKDIAWLNPSKTLEKIRNEIFNKTTIKEYKGRVPKSKFEEICEDERLREMLLENKVIFLDKTAEEGKKQFYIIPSFLPRFKDEEEDIFYIFDMKTPFITLKFEYFIPFGFINRVITTYGKAPDIKKYWRDMLIFTIEKSIKVLIKLEFEKLQIKLYIVADKKHNKSKIEYIKKELFEEILEFYHYANEIKSNLIDDKIDESKKRERQRDIIPEDLYVSVDERYFIDFFRLEKSEDKKEKESTIKDSVIAYKLDSSYKIDKEDSVTLSSRVFKNFSNNKEIKGMKKIFISYSRKDVQYRDELRKYLNMLSLFDIADNWACEDIKIGKWHEQIQKELEDSDLIIYMLSIDFFNSTYILEKEVIKGLELISTNPNKKILPIVVSEFPQLDKFEEVIKNPTDKQEKILSLKEFQFLAYSKQRNDFTKKDEERIVPLSELKNREELPKAFSEIVDKIIEILK